jgi:tRNA threonylcarbamoyl adenosine modification protein YeaZ
MSGWTLGPGVALGLELSAGAGSVAGQRGARLAQRSLASQRSHAADLVAQVAEVLRELGAGPRDLEALVVGLGPGSYTGLRVAAAAALGLARGSGAVLRGVASVEALARAELQRGECGAVLLDARAQEFYVAIYERTERGLEVRAAPRIAQAAELGAQLATARVLLADADAIRAAGLDPAAFERCVAPAPSAAPTLELGLEELARHGPHEPGAIEPLYLRAFAATRRKR